MIRAALTVACNNRGLIIASAIISAAFYVVLFGPRSLFLPSGIVLALTLFWVRNRYRILYGTIEFSAGVFTLSQQYPIGRGAFTGAFAEAFQRYDWHVVFLTILAGVYIMVRGLDNISQGWSAYRSKAA
jgi:uncharacterized membrane protein HdeD (DUF308 family)